MLPAEAPERRAPAAPVAAAARPRGPPTPTTGVPNASLLLASAERRARLRRPPTVDAARLVAEARAALDRMAAYQVAMHRQESVNGSLQPEEDVILAVRRQPAGGPPELGGRPAQGPRGPLPVGRAGRPDARQHGRLGLPIPRLSIPPDSPMVMKNSRHPITEAGFDSDPRPRSGPRRRAPA